MSTEEEIISIVIEAKTNQADEAKRKLDAVGASVNQLKADFAAGRVSQAQYDAGFSSLASQAETARVKLSALKDEMADLRRQGGMASTRLEGADRRGAQARLGLAAANITQDVAQGGPASAVNNLIALAGDPKIMALGAEFIAAAGGAAVLGPAIVGVGSALAGLFVVIDQGLKGADLKWSDFATVVGNTAPITATTEAFEGLAEVAKDLGITKAIDTAWDATGNLINAVAQVALGWNDATAATKAQNGEIERSTGSALEYVAALKMAASIRSDEQKKAAEIGKNVGEQLANLGGAGGLGAVASRLAEKATAKGADDKIKVPTIGKDGKPGDPEEITRRELARRDALTDLAKAAGGDTAALGRLMPKLKNAGFDLADVKAAAGGRDLDDEDKAGARGLKKADADAKQAAEKQQREHDRRTAELAKPLQERYDIGTARGNPIDESTVRGELESAGLPGEEAAKFASVVLGKLREGFDDEIRQRAGKGGITADQARQGILDDESEKAAKIDDAAEAKRKKAIEDQTRTARENAEAAEEARSQQFKDAFKGQAIDERTRNALMRAQLISGDPELAARRVGEGISRELQSGGMDKGGADFEANRYVEEQMARLSEYIDRQSMMPMEAERMRAAEHIGVADFARSVESAGQDYDKQSLDVQKQMLAALVEIGRRPPSGAVF